MADNIIIYDNAYKHLTSIDWSFSNCSQEALSQLHPYPARFIESLPRTLINVLNIPVGTAVLDPFCGSGTTLLEAQKANISSFGIDLNPIACLISRVKTQELPSNMSDVYKLVISESKKLIASGVEIPSIPNLDHWFNDDIQIALTAILELVNTQNDAILKDALLFCLSSIIVRVSNQDSDTRYAAINNNKKINDVYSDFESACKKLISAKKNQEYLAPSYVYNNNVLDFDASLISEPVGLVITSPPYPNAYEYWLYHKYRMWWLGYNPIYVRTNEIGARPHYHKKNGQTEVDFSQQMDVVFNLFDNCVVKNGLVCIVIGRSIIKGRFIDNSRIIISLAECHNYRLIANIERDIQSSRKSFNLSYGKITKENILIFIKEK